MVGVRRGFSDSGMLFLLLLPGKEPPSLTIPNQSDPPMTVGGGVGLDPEWRLLLGQADQGWAFHSTSAESHPLYLLSRAQMSLPITFKAMC